MPGVGQVLLFGAAQYAMRVWVRPDTLAKLQITVTEVINAIKAQNVVNPAGQVGAEPAPPGQEFTYNVTAQGRLIEAEQFGDIIVRANPDGSIVRARATSRASSSARRPTCSSAASRASRPASSPSTRRRARTRSRPPRP